jgi:hypothetical protein
MLEISSRISERRVLSPALEYQAVARDLVRSRMDEGRARAAAWAARQLGVSERRVLAVLHGEVRRVWADEMDRARAVHRAWLAEQMRRLDLERASIAVRLAALEDTHEGLLARVERAALDRAGPVGDGAGGSVPAASGGAADPLDRRAGERRGRS